MKTTMDNSNVFDRGERRAKQAAFSPFVEAMVRLGFAARGLIYLVIGFLAIGVANGGNSNQANQKGAISAINAQPFGHYLLIIVMVGLIGYAIWGLMKAFFDPLHVGSDAKGILQRIGFFISALTYGYLFFLVYGYVKGSGGSSGQSQQSVSGIMVHPWGRILILAVGLILAIVGLIQIFMGFSRRFDKQFRPYALDRFQLLWVKRLGRFGTIARGVIYGIIGVLMVQAAVQANPSKAQGFNSAIQALAQQHNGQILLIIVALGLIAFGLYSMTGAIWFRFRR